MTKQLLILQYIDSESLYSLLDSGSISMSLDSGKSYRGTFWTLMEVLSECSAYTIYYYIVWLVLEALNIVNKSNMSMEHLVSLEILFWFIEWEIHICVSLWCDFHMVTVHFVVSSLMDLHVISLTYLVQLDVGNMTWERRYMLASSLCIVKDNKISSQLATWCPLFRTSSKQYAGQDGLSYMTMQMMWGICRC